ncbi:Tryprostatin B 6-hydroxylase [Sphaceloma murrayae]|uniref:Tryprostatin B 6-hydroxylase n=1 Tax=Sphaceloma murrayae TaxID=2082308 RepID=A0A2K1QIQ5_9PEZI|nr:Tryprostatin B 6-hydroxylase [Sphaceloma murrayae]
MLVHIAISVALLVCISFLRSVTALRRHIREAQDSGIPHVITPIYYFNLIWLLSQRLVIPVLRKLPPTWTGLWLDVIQSSWAFRTGHRTFERVGSDTFIAVAPGKNLLFTADPDVISQVGARRLDFPKETDSHLYRRLTLFGSSIVTAEGEAWRRQRKIVAPSFSDRSNGLVFEESLRQAQFMLKSWTARGPILPKIAEDILRLSLYVICRAGFGVKNSWPGLEHEHDSVDPEDVDLIDLQKGRDMDFLTTLGGLLEHLIKILFIPSKLLARLPFRFAKEAHTVHANWTYYLSELYNAKQTATQSSTTSPGTIDLMGNMIHQSLSPDKDSLPLTKSEVIGNAFVFLMAGHETSAHTIQTCILQLAMNPHIQRLLQRDLDSILGSRPISEWSYESDFPRLNDGWAGAVMCESLRLVPSVINVPKVTVATTTINVEGRKCVIAPGTDVWLSVAGVGRNPRYWPLANGKMVGEEGAGEDDLGSWRAERWMAKGEMFRPVKGAFIPFSEGQRSCIGQRFARVEIVAVLAAIFKEWSVELVVDGLKEADEERKREIFEEASKKAAKTFLDGCTIAMTMRFSKGEIPIRLVRRGQESFSGL